MDLDHIIEKVLYCDGSYRDIYIRPVTKNDWQKFLVYIKNELDVQFFKDGVTVDFSHLGFDEIFCQTNGHAILMVINLKPVTLNCNFFTIEEIELDIDPKEVIDFEVYNRVIDFIKKLSMALNKEVILTPENCPDKQLLSCSPLGEVEYINIW